jgi:lysophospholipase L1-like esterase
MKWLKAFFINLFILLLLLVTLELVSRVILDKIYNRSFDSTLIEDNKYFTSPGLKANAQAMIWGRLFHTDQYGCRQPAKGYKPGKKKWLFIGDSVTEGVGVGDSAVFPSLVFDRNDSLNIFNYSLIGYSVNDYLNVLKSVLAKNDSTIERVSIFYCLNDVYGPTKMAELPVMARQDFMGQASAFMQQNYNTYKLIKLLLFQNSDRYFQYDMQFYKAGDEHFKNAMTTLLLCDSACINAGAAMDVVILPYRSQVSGADVEHRLPQTMVGNYCKSHYIHFLDPSDHLSKLGDPAALYLFADEIHFSRLGHRAVADYLLSQ